MRTSLATPSRARVSAAWRMVSQSDWLPITMPTAGAPLFIPLPTPTPKRAGIIGGGPARASAARAHQRRARHVGGEPKVIQDIEQSVTRGRLSDRCYICHRSEEHTSEMQSLLRTQ